MGVDNKMQSIYICFVQSEFLSKLFHNLSLNFGGVQLQCYEGYKRCRMFRPITGSAHGPNHPCMLPVPAGAVGRND